MKAKWIFWTPKEMAKHSFRTCRFCQACFLLRSWQCPVSNRLRYLGIGQMEFMSMSENGHSRQEHSTEKRPVMVYVPEQLHAYLVIRCEEDGMSMSAFMVWLLRRERSTKNVSTNTT